MLKRILLILLLLLAKVTPVGPANKDELCNGMELELRVDSQARTQDFEKGGYREQNVKTTPLLMTMPRIIEH